MPSGSVPRVRRSPIPLGAVLAVRGDELDAAVLAEEHGGFIAATRRGAALGISVFAGDDAEVNALCETKLRQWSTAAVFTRAALEGAGIEVVPTFRTPHVTLAHAALDQLVQRLLRCEHQVVANPYHEPDSGPLEAQ